MASEYRSNVGVVPRAGRTYLYYSPVKDCSILDDSLTSNFNYETLFRSKIILQVSDYVAHS